jgi:hypothetical protein
MAMRNSLDVEFSFTAHVLVSAPIELGPVPNGIRRYVPIVGGTVNGPSLNGEVLSLGGDDQIERADGVLEVDARYVIRTTDAVRIGVVNRGLRTASPEIMQRLARSESVDPSQYYFRTSPRLEAPVDSDYNWVNQCLFVGIAERLPTAAIIHFYRVL